MGAISSKRTGSGASSRLIASESRFGIVPAVDTVSSLIKFATTALDDSSVAARSESPRLDAMVLLGYVTGLSTTKLLTEPELEISEATCGRFYELIRERVRGVPVAYLVGEREFFSLPFAVSEAVLIPRPETEQLVELAVGNLKQRRPLQAAAPIRVLDLGCGSGCIAIAVALSANKLRIPVEIVAIDRSEPAVTVARRNAERLGADGIRFVVSDWFGALQGDFDLILTNPPYVPLNSPHLSGDTRFEPPSALFAGVDGCDAYRCILPNLARFLAPGGLFLGEHGIEQGAMLRQLAIQAGFAPSRVRTVSDLTKRDRFLMCEN